MTAGLLSKFRRPAARCSAVKQVHAEYASDLVKFESPATSSSAPNAANGSFRALTLSHQLWRGTLNTSALRKVARYPSRKRFEMSERPRRLAGWFVPALLSHRQTHSGEIRPYPSPQPAC
jgi:hypothetical protein